MTYSKAWAIKVQLDARKRLRKLKVHR